MAERVNALTSDQALAVLRYLKEKGNRRDTALWALGIGTGLRIAELLRLRACDLTVPDGDVGSHLQVRVNKMRRERSVPLIPFVRDAVAAYISESLRHTELLFPMTRQHAHRLVRDWCAAAGVEGQFGTHSMRKTFATIAYDHSGGDAAVTARVTGHSNSSQLMTYIGRTPATEQAIWDGVRDALAGCSD